MKGLERSMLVRALLACRTVAMAMMDSVSRSAELRPRVRMKGLIWSKEATAIPPLRPILQPFSCKLFTELFSCRRPVSSSTPFSVISV